MGTGLELLATLATSALGPAAATGAPLALASAPLNLLAFTTTAGGTAGILGLGAGGLGTALLNVGLSAGASYALSLLRERRADPSPTRGQQTVRSSIGPRRKFYGRAIAGGQVFFFAAANGNLQTGIALCDGPIDGFEQHLLNDNVADVTGVTVVNLYRWRGDERVRLYSRTGTFDQTAIDQLQGYYPGQWTAEHRGRGVALVVTDYGGVPQEDFRDVYPNGQPPGYRALIRAARVFDPRSQPEQDPTRPATWGWRENAACVIGDYLMDRDFGFGIPAERIAFDSLPGGFLRFAELCDEGVPKKAGGGEARYRVTGLVTADEEPAQVMSRLLATCDGELYLRPDAKLGIRGGRWDAPTFTITDEMITALTIEPGPDALQAYSGLKITVASENHSYQEIEAQPWIDADLEDAIGAEVLESLRLTMVPSASQGRRLGKIAIAKANPLWRGTADLTMAALPLIAERTARLACAEIGFDETVLLGPVKLKANLTGLSIEWQTLGPAPYAWDPATEEGETPPTIKILPPAEVPPAPTDLLVTFPRPTGFDDGAAVRADWAMSALWPHVSFEMRLSQSGRDPVTYPVAAELSTFTTPAVDPVSTVVEVRAVTPGGIKGGYATASAATPVYDSAAPAAPTDIRVTRVSGDAPSAVIEVDMPSSASVYLARVVIGSVDRLVAAAPSATVTVTVPDPGGTLVIDAYALNRSRISSAVRTESFV